MRWWLYGIHTRCTVRFRAMYNSDFKGTRCYQNFSYISYIFALKFGAIAMLPLRGRFGNSTSTVNFGRMCYFYSKWLSFITYDFYVYFVAHKKFYNILLYSSLCTFSWFMAKKMFGALVEIIDSAEKRVNNFSLFSGYKIFRYSLCSPHPFSN